MNAPEAGADDGPDRVAGDAQGSLRIAGDISARSRVLSYAHRGASAYAPENTIAAFTRAREMGAEFVEVDVHRSQDGHLVILHDATLERTTNARTMYPGREPWTVRDFTLAELQRLDAGSWFDARFAGVTIPTLDEALAFLTAHEMGVLIDAKAPARYPGLAEQIAYSLRAHPKLLLGGARRVVVQSLDWEFIRQFRAILPRVSVGLLGSPRTEDLEGFARFADQVNPMHTALDSAYVAEVHRVGMSVTAWTVNDKEAIAKVVALGVDGIITDAPDLIATA